MTDILLGIGGSVQDLAYADGVKINILGPDFYLLLGGT